MRTALLVRDLAHFMDDVRPQAELLYPMYHTRRVPHCVDEQDGAFGERRHFRKGVLDGAMTNH